MQGIKREAPEPHTPLSIKRRKISPSITQHPPLTQYLDSILSPAPKLTASHRQFITAFFTNPTLAGVGQREKVRQFVLDENVVERNGIKMVERVLFEINYATGEWKKMKACHVGANTRGGNGTNLARGPPKGVKKETTRSSPLKSSPARCTVKRQPRVASSPQAAKLSSTPGVASSPQTIKPTTSNPSAPGIALSPQISQLVHLKARLRAKTCVELRRELRQRKLPTKGKKNVLVHILATALLEQGGKLEPTVTSRKSTPTKRIKNKPSNSCSRDKKSQGPIDLTNDDHQKITIKEIRDLTRPVVYPRGLEYYRSGHLILSSLIKRGQKIEGLCVGSANEPYKVASIINHKGITFNYCSCPYNFSGICKHSVALLLQYCHNPESFDPGVNKLTVSAILRKMTKEQLINSIKRMIEKDPKMKKEIPGIELSDDESP